LEAWEKVLVSEEVVAEGAHASISCTQCHRGNNVNDFGEAHDGLVRDPSDAPVSVCGACHEEIQSAHEDSLHVTLAGYDTTLYERSTPENHPALEEMQANHCNSCHASCGQCHVSQPNSVGGGLLEGHDYVATPPMSRTCTGCHGSRVKNEYSGRNEGYPADVHLSQARMNCVDCHTGDEMHGAGVEGAHRYDGDRDPQCETCHADALASDSGITQHTLHGEKVACNVCHSVAYKNCASCHVQQTEDGMPYFETADSWMDFRIGRNPNPSPERPWNYVLVRHVPVDENSFEYYGEGLLPNFDARPTWQVATPHNIQRITPQTETCDSCHGNPDLFLNPNVVLAEEREANASVIVEELPLPNVAQ
jgi:thiosulfate/3-mercaptopyruvate sulfurtransferase